MALNQRPSARISGFYFGIRAKNKFSAPLRVLSVSAFVLSQFIQLHGFGFNVSTEAGFCHAAVVTHQEREIYNFLRAAPEVFYSVREIGRRTGGKAVRRNSPDWVAEHLCRMVRGGILETDNGGHYRLKQKSSIKADGRKWVSPHIAKLLKNSSNDFSKNVTIEIAENEADL